ncbi:MAG: hypothetical protein H8K10_02285 [Nitrospira sp.]|nr:hypothetical protein [Nitrospira sp.]
MFERRVVAVMSGMVALGLWMAWVEPVAAGVTTRMLPNGDAIELEFPTDVGTQKETLPLYHSGKIPYFSAGIGQVEREAAYPPFSLKLVFTAGGKPFVTGVEVVLRQSRGATLLTVPREQVTGPWLFIDLPDGTYEVAATLGGQMQQVKGIKVRRGHVTAQHVRWAEDRSPVLPAQAE